MRAAGLLLMLSGWALVFGAVQMLHGAVPRAAFVGAGLAVEALGLGLALSRQVAR